MIERIYTQALLPPGNLDQIATAALGLGEPCSVSFQAVEQCPRLGTNESRELCCVVKHWKSCRPMVFLELGTSVRFSRRAIFCCSLSGNRFENSEKSAHSSVKYQMCFSNALTTALEAVLLCHFSCNHLNHATTAAAGHCREHHHQKMSSVGLSTFIRVPV